MRPPAAGRMRPAGDRRMRRSLPYRPTQAVDRPGSVTR